MTTMVITSVIAYFFLIILNPKVSLIADISGWALISESLKSATRNGSLWVRWGETTGMKTTGKWWNYGAMKLRGFLGIHLAACRVYKQPKIIHFIIRTLTTLTALTAHNIQTLCIQSCSYILYLFSWLGHVSLKFTAKFNITCALL